MLKYYDYAIVMQEVPDEITLALDITNCPHKCEDCHSPHLRNDVGKELTKEEILFLLQKYRYCSCVCFMGGDGQHQAIIDLIESVKQCTKDIKFAMYSGDDTKDYNLIRVLDYYKIGHYDKNLGPLNKKTTNQIMYKINDGELTDITNKFWFTQFSM
mgnify:CR=1 FL=1